MKLDKRYLKRSAYAVGVMVLSALILLLLWNIPKLSAVLSPVITGFVIAYILNPILKFYEFKVFGFWQKKVSTRKQRGRIHGLSLVLTVITAILIVVGIFALIVPQLVTSFSKITTQLDRLPQLFSSLEKWMIATFGQNNALTNLLSDPINELAVWLNTLWQGIKGDIMPILADMGSSVVGVVSGVGNFIVAFVIGINFLGAKDMLMMQVRKVMHSLFSEEKVELITGFAARTNTIFIKYMVGVALDVLAVSCLCTIGCLLLGIPYALLIGVIVGLCNLIPFFGPFVAAVPSVFIILLEEPIKAVWFIIFLIILQQFDGNIMQPAIQGDVIGLPSVWVLAAIMVGGGAFGFVGMLLAIPTFAVIYMLFKEIVNYRLKSQGLSVDTYDYEKAAAFPKEEKSHIKAKTKKGDKQ